jgi:N-acetylglucosaminyldiphosphoundecaprenol N-acetyl-beta-D-mannosaminyltransferase
LITTDQPIRTITLGVRIDAIRALDVVKRVIESVIADDRAWLCTFVNPASVVRAGSDITLRQILNDFDMVLPDGMGTVLAVRWLHRCPAARISFDSTSLAPIVFQLAADWNVSVALVGGEPGVAERAGARIRDIYSNLTIATF